MNWSFKQRSCASEMWTGNLSEPLARDHKEYHSIEAGSLQAVAPKPGKDYENKGLGGWTWATKVHFLRAILSLKMGANFRQGCVLVAEKMLLTCGDVMASPQGVPRRPSNWRYTCQKMYPPSLQHIYKDRLQWFLIQWHWFIYWCCPVTSCTESQMAG